MSNEKLAMNNEQREEFFTTKLYGRGKKDKGIKIGLLPLLFVTCYLLFILACQSPFDPPRTHKPGVLDAETANDVGYVSLSIAGNGGGGRTIMPTTVLEEELFDGGYTLVFSAEGHSAVIVERDNVDPSDEITLTVGTWALEITAYKLDDDGETKLPLARGNITGIAITTNATTPVYIALKPISSDGTGTFSWDITLPATADIVSATMTITPLDAGGSAEQTLWLAGADENNTPTSDTITLNSGAYRMALSLYNGAITRKTEKYLYIYQNMESNYTDDFTGVFNVTLVTIEGDNGPGSLRQAITSVPANGMICIADDVEIIRLNSRLLIPSNKTFIIEGNSVTLTRAAATWTTTDSNSQLLYISSNTTVSISRVHFKDGRATDYGAAIRNDGNLTLESCIFTGNQTTNGGADGGAIYSTGNLTVKGCTFYNNRSGNRGGAIEFSNGSGTLTLTGNVFYGNTALNGPVVYRVSGTVISGGYNVVDVALGTGTNQAGWTAITEAANADKTIGVIPPISFAAFKPLHGGGAVNVLSSLPAGYPMADFYGNIIPAANAAAGAVQTVAVNGSYIYLLFNNPDRGTVTPAPDEDGLYADGTTLTANARDGYLFGYWLVNDSYRQTSSTLTVNGHAKVTAIFGRAVSVTSNVDNTTDAVTTPGTLRHALTNLQDWDVISIDLTGDKTITLTSALPNMTGNITIKGNGVTLTRTASWTDSIIRLLTINSGTVSISRIHFKDGRMGDYGAALNNAGNLTLESCIFSGNRTTNGGADGGAIYSTGNLTVKGCTFYNNSTAGNRGGAIEFNNGSGTLSLTGNLFYGNTAANSWPVVYRASGTVISGGYNVVDVALGTGTNQAGWDAATGDNADKTIGTAVSSLPISGATFRRLQGSGAANAVRSLPTGYPAVDFYGDPLPVSNAAAGAVQSATVSGYYLDLSINNPTLGNVTFPESYDDSVYANGTTLTLTPNANNGYSFGYWLINGNVTQTGNTFTVGGHAKVQAVFGRAVSVTSSDNGDTTTPGTLRYALTAANLQEGDVISIDLTGDKTITLTSLLPNISKSVTIIGNGVTLMRAASWTDGNSRLLTINSGTVSISRIHFKDGRMGDYGAALNNAGNLTLESCIFSGNRTTSSGADGGAIYSTGNLTVKGCTFYNNSTAGNRGGAIEFSNGSGTLSLTGNLFYGNTAASSWPVVYRPAGTVISGGYNVVDVALGTGTNQAGWDAATGANADKTIVAVSPLFPATFELLQGSSAANVIGARIEAYPKVDFYGVSIPTANAAAGAVQTGISGYHINITQNNSAAGTVAKSSEPDSNNLYTGGTTLTANVNNSYTFEYWLVNGVKQIGSTLTINGSAQVHAVFSRTVTVDSNVDNTSNAAPGTLRHALTAANLQEGDIINIELTGDNTIRLTGALPQITGTKSIIINGNGVTLTRATNWTGTNDASQLLYINSNTAVVSINRIHFKDGRATDAGAAIRNLSGILTLESCIFSGNQTSSSSGNGGAVQNAGTLTVKGCTFYNNSAYIGGAIRNRGTLSLTGNLFYGNTAANSAPAVSNPDGTVSSGGYNVVDVALGTGNNQAGWTAVTGASADKSIGTAAGNLPLSPITFKLLQGSGAASFIGNRPAGYPTADFYGASIPTAYAAAGAVQTNVNNMSGYYLDLSINNSALGAVIKSSDPDEDGVYDDGTTLEASPNGGYSFEYWLINDSVKQSGATFTITSHARKVQAVFSHTVIVNSPDNGTNSTPGTLRYALYTAQHGDIISIELPGDNTIRLTDKLPSITGTKSITIKGNGVTLTRAASWTLTDNTSQLLYINSSTAVVSISRMHFKDGRATDVGAAIRNDYGNLTLESCIFSGNHATSNSGGAMYNNGTMTVKGCTFYDNRANSYGGTIYNNNSATLSLTGNLFYANTAGSATSYPVVYPYNNGMVTSGGYNVVDVALGTGNNQAGWTAITGGADADRTIGTDINNLPISGATFRLLQNSGGAANVINTLPANYPTADFYGTAIPAANAAAGAVQTYVSNMSGYYNIGLSINNSARGTVTPSPAPDQDGLYANGTTLTAAPQTDCWFVHWLVNDSVRQSGNTFIINGHAKVQAVFGRVISVSSLDNGTNTTSGTLRYALYTAQDWDIINITAGPGTIQLASALPEITKSITINGNGVTLTRTTSFTEGSSSQLLRINSANAVVSISRVWFKDGRATDWGGAICNNAGNLTLESCIFSGNQPGSSSGGNGGAIVNNGTMTVKGCTFYDNRTNGFGGAIFNNSNSVTLSLTGNLFYGNTASNINSSHVVYRSGGTVISGGYNVADGTLVTNPQSGYVPGTGDTTFSALGIAGAPFVDAVNGDFTPDAGLRVPGVMPASPIAGFPAADFKGVNRDWPGAAGAVK